MSLFQTLAALGRQSLTEPRPAAANLMALGLPIQAVWLAFFLVNILGVMIAFFLPGADPGGSPIMGALFATGVSFASVVVILKVGQALGGTGTFGDTLLLMTFLSAIVFAGQIVQLVLTVVLPPMAFVFGIAVILFAVWLNVNFIAAVHGFSSLMRALGVLVLGSFILAVIMMIVLTLTGNMPEPPA